MSLTDQSDHEMNITEVSDTRKSGDPLWNNSQITCGLTDLFDCKGSQRGYFNNVHADKGRDWETFAGKATAAGAGLPLKAPTNSRGKGEYRGLTGGGKF